MATAPVAPIYSNSAYVQAQDNPVKSKKPDMGKDDFLKLIIAQLKNQDPLNPVKDTEFIAQLASFSGLEQSRNTAKSVEEASAVGMIGKSVTDIHENVGIVSKVSVDAQGTHLTVDTAVKDKDGSTKIVPTVVDYSEIKEITNP